MTTQSVEMRWNEHRWNAKRGNGKLARSIAKYGAEAFTVEVIATVPTRDEAGIAERIAIAIRRPSLNLTRGGEGIAGYTWTPEARANLAAAARKRRHSEESKAKMRAAKLGRTLSPEHREKIGAAGRGRRHSAEHNRKIGDANRRRAAEKRGAL